MFPFAEGILRNLRYSLGIDTLSVRSYTHRMRFLSHTQKPGLSALGNMQVTYV
jgi:hypothetical protein